MTTEADFAELRRWHDAAIAEGQQWAHTRYGLCGIVAVTFYPPDRPGACMGECLTDLAETFGIFSQELLEAAEEARANRDRVRLDVRRSHAGHRYITRLQVLDVSRNPTPCLACDTLAPKVPATPEVPEHFACPSCHALWFLQPVTRSYR